MYQVRVKFDFSQMTRTDGRLEEKQSMFGYVCCYLAKCQQTVYILGKPVTFGKGLHRNSLKVLVNIRRAMDRPKH